MKQLVVLVIAAMVAIDVDAQNTVDWIAQGAVTPPRSMGDDTAGSCVYAVAGALEGLNFIQTGALVQLSPQNLMDCAFANASLASPDLVPEAFQYTVDNGIDTEASYPYQGYQGVCQYDQSNVGATATNFTYLPSGDEIALMEAVTTGPVVASIDGTNWSFQFYSGGIYNEPNCENAVEKLNQVVLIVGYGTTPEGVDYWLVKTSWGDGWGQGGYIQMSRNSDNQCGIATAAVQVM